MRYAINNRMAFQMRQRRELPPLFPFPFRSLPSLFQEHGDMLTGKNSILWQQSVLF